eukprot:CAMPEP_0175058166 /NCGR_PEP_ID=MMETSP0052_2-20121109/11691_1 /TAXON_ID=51329 ORGANISM="Polytomella parva, Strain SAG 63-3" /NCGR_SAMPLE_ID=MMETSP0052_2 /ASSEMBLY_ACC=CAM_ASM_000194 /LENGTH=54 /DNA_ID=CAMNT_0016323505 /DNA_START=391 /DNA_END=555 /DNA_ORIENTATION=-
MVAAYHITWKRLFSSLSALVPFTTAPSPLVASLLPADPVRDLVEEDTCLVGSNR